MPVTINTVRDYKRRGERFAMLTAYDYTTARILAAAEIPVILVGDSLGMLMLGHRSTLPVTMEDMLHHAGAVARGAPDQLLVGDLPFGSYQSDTGRAIDNAARFLQAGMHAVKLEGGGYAADLTAQMTERGIPVMGHVGLTPQFTNLFGGFRVQGKEEQAAERIRNDANDLQSAGAFAVVVEGVPRQLAKSITEELDIPTIGIGAGPDCDAQVLVVHDMLGLTQDPMPKFVRSYADLGNQAIAAARAYAQDVKQGVFPDDAHSYH
ncbi:MAG TPA: 3-methyl-2-oxobutanoate hydroxymethyltransferase [Candidatus Dormibacteraeota bacterium]|jgi:3-methyl-2-oxobutanoate hydroxymethyltransferase|nr:3-methyl-2-oxobutanoate hydroxymethyltransferase [Candidatus Dormibacteraeota bacterium]